MEVIFWQIVEAVAYSVTTVLAVCGCVYLLEALTGEEILPRRRRR